MTLRGFLILCLWIAAPWLMLFLWLAGGLRGELGREAMSSATALIVLILVLVAILATTSFLGAAVSHLG